MKGMAGGKRRPDPTEASLLVTKPVATTFSPFLRILNLDVSNYLARMISIF
jgi:hypothetical protein